jgi:hypothetical protein
MRTIISGMGFLLIIGCSSIDGPISGKKYSVVDGQVVNMPAYAKELHEDYLQKNPSINKKYQEAITQGYLIIGMNKEQVKESWGLPDRINITTLQGLSSEQWVFRLYHNAYAYFHDDKLISVQTFSD